MAKYVFKKIVQLTAFRRSCSDAVHVVKPLTQLRRKLIGESFPILFAHLIFESKQYLDKRITLYIRLCRENIELLNCPSFYLLEHFLQILFRRRPRRYGVTKEDKVWDDTGRVNSDHLTHTSEGRILLFVISYASQRSAPINKFTIDLLNIV